MEPKETVILVAEDEAVVRNLVRLMLSRLGSQGRTGSTRDLPPVQGPNPFTSNGRDNASK